MLNDTGNATALTAGVFHAIFWLFCPFPGCCNRNPVPCVSGNKCLIVDNENASKYKTVGNGKEEEELARPDQVVNYVCVAHSECGALIAPQFSLSLPCK